MGKKEGYKNRMEEHPLLLMEEHGSKLIGMEYVKEVDTWYLRAYIDKEGGAAVDDYEVISRALSDWLDKEDFTDNNYILEVSSPGLGRPPKKEGDSARSMGEDVGVGLCRQLNEQKELTGALSIYGENTMTLTMEDRGQMVFEKADITLIRLMLDFQLDHPHAETQTGG